MTNNYREISFSYDTANRRTGLTLPNGMALAYSYDQDSRVTGMTWTLSGNQVGNLTYSYDADGRVIDKSGSLQPFGNTTVSGSNTSTRKGRAKRKKARGPSCASL